MQRTVSIQLLRIHNMRMSCYGKLRHITGRWWWSLVASHESRVAIAQARSGAGARTTSRDCISTYAASAAATHRRSGWVFRQSSAVSTTPHSSTDMSSSLRTTVDGSAVWKSTTMSRTLGHGKLGMGGRKNGRSVPALAARRRLLQCVSTEETRARHRRFGRGVDSRHTFEHIRFLQ